ncbi:hypothetical protein FTX61_03760 [Nitriliruptoraceae bacterium ZYF776]|nr:hypothetical protein [Profundirhabdus halotolerans]
MATTAPPQPGSPPPALPDGEAPSRTIRRPRSLPGGRAVVGALLVAVAVVGVVAAHLSATATPDTSYLVAAADVPAGTLLGDEAAVEERFAAVALDLPPEVASQVVPLDGAASLVGQRTTAALAAGDPLLASTLTAGADGTGASTLTFALPPEAAVGGRLTVGEHIDVVATVGTGESATTAYVVRAAPLLDVVTAGDASGLGADRVQLTVSLDDQRSVQALAHALATATVVVVRSPDDGADVPAPYRFGDAAPGSPSDTTAPDAEVPDTTAPDAETPDAEDVEDER